jgi:hypothetical protein
LDLKPLSSRAETTEEGRPEAAIGQQQRQEAWLALAGSRLAIRACHVRSAGILEPATRAGTKFEVQLQRMRTR